jgi:hypothetical protein
MLCAPIRHRIFLRSVIRTILVAGNVLALTLATAHVCAAQGNLEIQTAETWSERLGDVITPESRLYFGLLPGFDGFVEASLVVQNGITRLEVKSQDGARRDTLPLPTATLLELRRYIDSFEELHATTTDVMWHLLHRYARPKRTPPRGMRLSIETLDGTVHEGYLLQARHDAVVLTTQGDPIARFRDTRAAIVVLPHEIDLISRGSVTGLLRGNWPARVAGRLDRYEHLVLQSLAHEAALPDALSPELASLRDEVVRSAPAAVFSDVGPIGVPVHEPPRRVRLGLSWLVEPHSYQNSALQTGFGDPVQIMPSTTIVNVGVSARYQLSGRWNVGTSIRYHAGGPNPELPPEDTFRYSSRALRDFRGTISSTRTAVDLHGGVDVIQAMYGSIDRYGHAAIRNVFRVELSLGPSLSRMHNTMTVVSARDHGPNVRSPHVGIHDQVGWHAGLNGGLEMSIQPRPDLTLAMRVQVTHYPRAAPPDLHVIAEGQPEYDRTLSYESSSLTFIGFGPHLRLHL